VVIGYATRGEARAEVLAGHVYLEIWPPLAPGIGIGCFLDDAASGGRILCRKHIKHGPNFSLLAHFSVVNHL